MALWLHIEFGATSKRVLVLAEMTRENVGKVRYERNDTKALYRDSIALSKRRCIAFEHDFMHKKVSRALFSLPKRI